ncbi:MAG: RAMP superfamily CRISPR-associated protein [Bacillota bacterium]
MEIKKYEGYLLAKSTIHHGGDEKTGSTPTLRTIYMFTGDGEGVPIPYINGNSIRGKLRRLLMKEFFDLLEIKTEDLSPKLYHTFFTGGVLESTEDTYAIIDLALRKGIRELLIPISLMGCAIGNQIMQGKLKVGHAFPVCREYKEYLPTQLKQDKRCEMTVRSFTDESFRTRKDDLRTERAEDEQAMQMKVDYECFIPGTKFYHWFMLECPNKLDEACFGRFMEIFKSAPFIGGMSSIGNGEVEFEYQPELSKSQPYLAFLLTKKDEIRTLIERIGEGIK